MIVLLYVNDYENKYPITNVILSVHWGYKKYLRKNKYIKNKLIVCISLKEKCVVFFRTVPLWSTNKQLHF
jgi:hypothetical protein